MASKEEKSDSKGEKGEKAEKAPKAAGGGGAAGGKSRKPKGETVQIEMGKAQDSASEPPRFKVRYKNEIAAQLRKQFNYKNAMQVPRLQKIVINMGLGEAVQNPKLIESAVVELAKLSGQRPVVTRAKKAIANFK